MEVPVAVPLRVPSLEACRRSTSEEGIQEEMDIGAAVSSAPLPLNHDLLGLGLSPPSDIPSAGRFSINRPQNTTQDEVQASVLSDSTQSNKSLQDEFEASHSPRAQQRRSYDRKNTKNGNIMRGGRRRGTSLTASLFGGDDAEGDLGYAAASDMENAKKKVIMERLETVKANNPVFSWC